MPFRTFCLFVSLLLSFLVTSCSSRLVPEKPAERYLAPDFQPQPSSISLPVEMTVTSLEAFLNRQLTGVLYEDNNLQDDNLMLKAWKQDNIKLGFENGTFTYRVPVKLWIKAGWKIDKFGITLSDYREVNAAIALKFRSAISVNRDWTVKTVTTSDGYEWISKPVIRVGPVEIPITIIADILVKNNMETINTAIDEGLQSSLDLKTNARQAWTDIQNPILLDEEYGLWLRIIPKAVSAMPISGGKGVIRHTSAIQVIAECFAGKQPPFQLNPNLPDITPMQKPGDDFVLNINSYIPFSYVDSMSRVIMLNTSYDFGKRHIVITGIGIYGDEGKMIIETTVTGSVNGKLYFEGVPAYRQSDSSIVVTNLQFHIKTKNLLLKTAGWLANGGIEKAIEKRMYYPVGSYIRETCDLIRENLKNYPLSEGFFIRGRLNQLQVRPPVLAPGAIIAPLLIEGRLNIGLE